MSQIQTARLSEGGDAARVAGGPVVPSRRRGFALVLVLAITASLLFVALATSASSLFVVRGSSRQQSKVNGQFLADAGIDAAVDQFTTATPAYGTQYGVSLSITGGTNTLYQNPPTNTVTVGTYTIAATQLNPLQYIVNSTGTAKEGKTSSLVALVAATGGKLGGNAAIYANGPVNIGGTLQVTTNPVNRHDANVYANGDISMGGSSVVDGFLASAATVTGTAYYPSLSGAPRFAFPDVSTTNTWKTNWSAQALAANNTYQNLKNVGVKTISGSAYINGSLSLGSGDVLTLDGNADDNVVFINGDLSLTSNAILNNKVTLIVTGSFSQTGQSMYQIQYTDGKASPALVVYGTGGSYSSNTISLAGGSSGIQQGVIYSVLGNIKVSGGSTVVGVLVAGGAGSGVAATGGYTQIYPEQTPSAVKFSTQASVQMLTEP